MAIRLARMLGARAAPGTTQEYEAHVFGRMLETLRTNAALVGVLALSAFLNLWHLTDNGYGNSYYAAAVRSMTQSWHNFFFASFDPGGFITVDKPPVGLWMQAASAKVFGYSGFTILMPEALAGIGSVFVLYLAVSRVFGKTAGVIAGLVLAITPITVAINRSNNLDAWLIFFTVCAAYAVVRACENASWRWLAVSTLMIGIAFNTKTLAGFVALPPLMFAYAVCAPTTLKRRVRDLAIAGVVLAVVSGAWVAAVDLTPASSRPYVGGSTENSELDLLLHYNGLGRIDGDEQGFPGGAPPGGIERPEGAGLPGGQQRPGAGNVPGGQLPGGGTLPGGQVPGGGQRPGAGQLPNGGTTPNGGTLPGATGLPPFSGAADGANARPGAAAPGGPGGRGFTGGQSGPLRLFNHEISSQASWLLPLALIGGLGALLSVGKRLEGNQRLASIIVWGGWLVTAGVVFSQASGIFHPYYLSYLGPALGGMVGIAAVGFWSAARDRSRLAFFAPLALAATAAFELSVLHLTPDYKPWLVFALAFPVAIGAIVMMINLVRAVPVRWSAAALGLALVGVLLPPMVWSSSVIASGVNGALPFVDPASTTERNFGPRRTGRDLPGATTGAVPASPGELRVNSGLVSYLEANKGGAKYLVATESSMNAAGIIIDTGEPVMAIGGFSGSDPALTLDQFASLVENGTVRYFLVGGGFGGPPGAFAGGANALPNLTPEQREYLRQAVTERAGDAPDARGGPGARRAGTRSISQAVAQAGKLVDTSAYGGTSGGQLYDLQGTAAALRAARGQ